MHPFRQIVEILTVPIPLKTFVNCFVNATLPVEFTDPEAAQSGMTAPTLLIESTDPASAHIVITISPKNLLNLFYELYCVASISPLGRLLEQFEKVADREGVSPKISPRILRSGRKPGSSCEFGHEPSRYLWWTIRSHVSFQRQARCNNN